jgi:transposase
MEETLVAPHPTTESVDLIDLVQQLRTEVIELRNQIADLRCDNFDLRKHVGYWKAMHARAAHRAQKLEAEVEQLRGENRKLQDQLFGRKSEKDLPRDRSNHLDGEERDQASSEPTKRGQRKDRPGPTRRDYAHLPVVEGRRELPVDRRVCPQCGAGMSLGDTEDSEPIEIDVRGYRRRIRRQRYQRTCTCPNGPQTVIAPPVPKLIPKGLLGVSVWVEILLDKYSSHRPTERLLAHWRWLDLDVAGGTVAGGLKRLEPLFQPLHQALLARNARSAFAQADETESPGRVTVVGSALRTVSPVPDRGYGPQSGPYKGRLIRAIRYETRWMVFISQQGKSGYQWWLWVFLGADTVAYRLDPSRSHEVPEGHCPDDASVVVMVDRYSAYKAMSQVKTGHVILVDCWAHVRRDFVKVGKGWDESNGWALAWLRRIRVLYRHHRQRSAPAPGGAAFAVADAEIRRAVAAMQTQVEAELADPKLPTPCRKVLVSLQEHWVGLTRFVDDLRIPLDNNATERQARGPALGRKNYYGSGALWSGRLAAMLFSLFATLTLAKLNIRRWLTWYLQSCAESGGEAPGEIAPFLPWGLTGERRRELMIDPDDSS